MKLRKLDKKGVGVIAGTVTGVIGLIFTVLIGFVLIDTITGAGLLSSGGASDNATDQMVANFTTGVDSVSSKLPTILLIVAVVFLFGAIALLVLQARRMGMFGGGSM